jgi:hypothetical protein
MAASPAGPVFGIAVVGGAVGHHRAAAELLPEAHHDPPGTLHAAAHRGRGGSTRPVVSVEQ